MAQMRMRRSAAQIEAALEQADGAGHGAHFVRVPVAAWYVLIRPVCDLSRGDHDSTPSRIDATRRACRHARTRRTAMATR
jgi:hypothetical protein